MKSAWEVDENEQWSEKVRRPWGEWCMCWGGGGGGIHTFLHGQFCDNGGEV